MREFILSDVFKASRIIEKAKMSDAIKNIYAMTKDMKKKSLEGLSDKEELTDEDKKQISETKEKILKEAGGELISFVMSAMSNQEIEKQIYDLLAGVAEKETSDIEKMKLKEVKALLVEISEKNDLKDFFSNAVELI